MVDIDIEKLYATKLKTRQDQTSNKVRDFGSNLKEVAGKTAPGQYIAKKYETARSAATAKLDSAKERVGSLLERVEDKVRGREKDDELGDTKKGKPEKTAAEKFIDEKMGKPHGVINFARRNKLVSVGLVAGFTLLAFSPAMPIALLGPAIAVLAITGAVALGQKIGRAISERTISTKKADQDAMQEHNTKILDSMSKMSEMKLSRPEVQAMKDTLKRVVEEHLGLVEYNADKNKFKTTDSGQKVTVESVSLDSKGNIEVVLKKTKDHSTKELKSVAENLEANLPELAQKVAETLESLESSIEKQRSSPKNEREKTAVASEERSNERENSKRSSTSDKSRGSEILESNLLRDLQSSGITGSADNTSRNRPQSDPTPSASPSVASAGSAKGVPGR